MTDVTRGLFLKPHEPKGSHSGTGCLLVPYLTVWQNIAFGAQPQTSGINAAQMVERID